MEGSDPTFWLHFEAAMSFGLYTVYVGRWLPTAVDSFGRISCQLHAEVALPQAKGPLIPLNREGWLGHSADLAPSWESNPYFSVVQPAV
jgi:hypothetical protein